MMAQKHPNEGMAIKVGEQAPDFTLLDTDNQVYTLSPALAFGPIVLVFYRGDW